MNIEHRTKNTEYRSGVAYTASRAEISDDRHGYGVIYVTSIFGVPCSVFDIHLKFSYSGATHLGANHPDPAIHLPVLRTWWIMGTIVANSPPITFDIYASINKVDSQVRSTEIFIATIVQVLTKVRSTGIWKTTDEYRTQNKKN